MNHDEKIIYKGPDSYEIRISVKEFISVASRVSITKHILFERVFAWEERDGGITAGGYIKLAVWFKGFEAPFVYKEHWTQLSNANESIWIEINDTHLKIKKFSGGVAQVVNWRTYSEFLSQKSTRLNNEITDLETMQKKIKNDYFKVSKILKGIND